MSTTRRGFLYTTAAAAGAVGLGVPLSAETAPAGRGPRADAPARKLRLLILGGTGFTGPHQVRYAVERGHTVTVFNRGRRQADLPESVEHLVGDRNGDLESLKGRTWDVVIDNPTTLPNWVRLSGELLKDACEQYIFISTISVYADNSRPGMDETTPVAVYDGEADPFTLPVEESGRFYGALKALSERETGYWFPGRATIIRPGLIVGPGDETDRFTYWPARIHRGGEVLAPGTPDDATQIIDARDLAHWTIRMAEQGTVGVFNATGPEEPRSMREMLEGIRAALGSDARFTWVEQDFLAVQEVRGWSHMPVWVPVTDESAAFMRVSVERARAAGLTYRSLGETARATLAYYLSRSDERNGTMRAGLPAEREREVLAAWHAR
ncbi:MAG: NAD-dependent epimerase/dehydratase family protein [Gemmatimonadota bacterium]